MGQTHERKPEQNSVNNKKTTFKREISKYREKTRTGNMKKKIMRIRRVRGTTTEYKRIPYLPTVRPNGSKFDNDHL